MFHLQILSQMKKIEEKTLYNVLYDDKSQTFIVASSYGRAASAAMLLKESEVICITKVRSVNVFE